MVVGIVSAVAGAALVGFACFVKRRRDTREKNAQLPPVPPAHDDGNDSLERGHGQPGHAQPPSYAAVLALGNGGDEPLPPPYPTAETEGNGGADVAPPSAPAAAFAGPVESSTGRAANSTEDRDGAGLAGEGTEDSSAEKSATNTASTTTATISTASVTTSERAELAAFHQRQGVADAAPATAGHRPGKASGGGGGGEAPSAADRRSSAGDIGLGRAVLEAAQELARQCMVPGISEAAAVLCIMANLVTDGRENDKASNARLRQYRSIVMALKRAERVVCKVSSERAGLPSVGIFHFIYFP